MACRLAHPPCVALNDQGSELEPGRGADLLRVQVHSLLAFVVVENLLRALDDFVEAPRLQAAGDGEIESLAASAWAPGHAPLRSSCFGLHHNRIRRKKD